MSMLALLAILAVGAALITEFALLLVRAYFETAEPITHEDERRMNGTLSRVSADFL